MKYKVVPPQGGHPSYHNWLRLGQIWLPMVASLATAGWLLSFMFLLY